MRKLLEGIVEGHGVNTYRTITPLPYQASLCKECLETLEADGHTLVWTRLGRSGEKCVVCETCNSTEAMRTIRFQQIQKVFVIHDRHIVQRCKGLKNPYVTWDILTPRGWVSISREGIRDLIRQR